MKNPSWLSRTELLIGEDKLKKLQSSHVLIVGLGGVGSSAAEFICRSGVGEMTIVDGDIIEPTNRNRQLPALKSTEGKAKAEVVGERLLDINPELKLHIHSIFVNPEEVNQILNADYDYVIDAIDSFTPKIIFIESAYKKGIPMVSSMGAGGKLNPTEIKVDEFYKTYNCKLAFKLRKKLRKLNVGKGIKAVFSAEASVEGAFDLTDGNNYKKSFYGTISYMPAAFGLVAASVAIQDLINEQ